MAEEEDTPRVYSIRFTPRAQDELREAAVRLGEISGTDIAEEWAEGLVVAISQLATKPRQFPLVPESHFTRETRNLVYHRPGSSIMHRALYVIEEESDDGPTVTVFHLRHSAARPIGRTVARKREDAEE